MAPPASVEPSRNPNSLDLKRKKEVKNHREIKRKYI
jgi:hypothetical protein